MTRLQGHWFPRGVISFDDPLRACEIAARAEVAMASQLRLMPGFADFRDEDMMVRLVGGRYSAGRSQACAALAAGAPCSLAPAQTSRFLHEQQRDKASRNVKDHLSCGATILTNPPLIRSRRELKATQALRPPIFFLPSPLREHSCPSHPFLSAETQATSPLTPHQVCNNHHPSRPRRIIDPSYYPRFS